MALFLLLHLIITLATVLTFGLAPSFRYLQPASVLAILSIALCLSPILSTLSPGTSVGGSVAEGE